MQSFILKKTRFKGFLSTTSMFLSRLLPALLLAVVSAVAQEPQWIWHTQQSADDEVRYFRKTFTLPTAPAEATLSVACDNRAKVFVNGTEIPGAVGKDEFQQLIDEKVKLVAASGVPANDYYQQVVVGKGEKKFRSKKDPKP